MYKQLYRIYRVIVTALLFIVFGLGGLFLALIVFNLISIVIRDNDRRIYLSRYITALSFRFFLSLSSFLHIIKLDLSDFDVSNLPKSCVIVANHPTLLDYVILASVFYRSNFVVKEEVLSNVFLKGVAKASGYIANSEHRSLMDKAIKIIHEGQSLIIFPEGTRSRSRENLKLKRGAANIAVRAGCDVQVVYLTCSEPFLDKTHSWHHIPSQCPEYRLRLGNLINMDDFIQSNSQHSEPSILARILTNVLAVEMVKAYAQWR